MSEEGCKQFKLKKGSGFCEHYCGDMFKKYQVLACHLNCSVKIMTEKSRIDVNKCTE